jgi:aryl-alcohol dehydrogenase-like predicted oxidoreductase
MITKRNLDSSDLLVSPIDLGGNVFEWTIGESESFKILDAFVDSGFNFIDTADSYSKWAPGNQGGESETIISKWLRKSGKRKEVIIATKFGVDLSNG